MHYAFNKLCPDLCFLKMHYSKFLSNCTVTYLHDIFNCDNCLRSVRDGELDDLQRHGIADIPNEVRVVNRVLNVKDLSVNRSEVSVSPDISNHPQYSDLVKSLLVDSERQPNENNHDSGKIKLHFVKKQAKKDGDVTPSKCCLESRCGGGNNFKKRVGSKTPRPNGICSSGNPQKYLETVLPYALQKSLFFKDFKFALEKKKGVEAKVAARNNKKQPRKGTLKRKRWFMNKLKECSENYEDDFLEDHKCHDVFFLSEDSDSDSDYSGVTTPELNIPVSPERAMTPVFEDCYDPAELNAMRKEAEEYHFRRCKRKKLLFVKEKSTTDIVKKKSINVHKAISEVAKILNKRKMQEEKESCDEEDEDYLSGSEEEMFINDFN